MLREPTLLLSDYTGGTLLLVLLLLAGCVARDDDDMIGTVYDPPSSSSLLFYGRPSRVTRLTPLTMQQEKLVRTSGQDSTTTSRSRSRGTTAARLLHRTRSSATTSGQREAGTRGMVQKEEAVLTVGRSFSQQQQPQQQVMAMMMIGGEGGGRDGDEKNWTNVNDEPPSRFFVESHRDTDSIDHDEDEDDRTLLDIFGEVAKEFLTQRLIPPTDADCRWDWRSLQCEPAGYCHYRMQWGDYHLGRACRRTEWNNDDHDDADQLSKDATNTTRRRGYPHVDASTSSTVGRQNHSLPARDVAWLIRQNWGALHQQLRKSIVALQQGLRHSMDRILARLDDRLAELQSRVCDRIWTLLKEHYRDNSCWPSSRIPAHTIRERVLCGPMDFVVCADE